MDKEWLLIDPLQHNKVIADGLMAETESGAAYLATQTLGYNLMTREQFEEYRDGKQTKTPK